MDNVVDLFKNKYKPKFNIQYIEDDGVIIGVTCPEWPFRIQRKDDKIALVCMATDEPFGVIDAVAFNTLVACWLLVDDPPLVDQMTSHDKE